MLGVGEPVEISIVEMTAEQGDDDCVVGVDERPQIVTELVDRIGVEAVICLQLFQDVERCLGVSFGDPRRIACARRCDPIEFGIYDGADQIDVAPQLVGEGGRGRATIGVRCGTKGAHPVEQLLVSRNERLGEPS